MKELRKKLNNPRFKHGTASTVITLTFLAIIILIYVISIKLHDKYNLSIDMTSKKIFEISQESKDYLQSLDKDIIIRVLLPEKDFLEHPYYPEQYNQVNRILKTCKKYGKNILLIYDDIIKNPKLADKYDSEISQYSVVVESKTDSNRYRVLDIDNLFEINQGYGSIDLTSSKAEQAVISSIMAITSDDQVRVGFLSGHQESDLSGFKKLLSDNLYQVSDINLLTTDIPQELSLIIIATPEKDFTTDEIKKLDQYLDNDGKLGKNILYFAGLNQGDLPNLESFLSKWDFSIEKAVVYDQVNMTQLGQYSSIVEYSDSDLFKALIDKNAYTVFLSPRLVRFTGEDTEEKTHSEFLSFSSDAVGLSYKEDSIESVDNPSFKGPFAAIAKTSKFLKTNKNNVSSVIVSGSIFSVDSVLLYNMPVANAQAYLKIISNITDKKNIGVNIVPKEFSGEKINIKQSTVEMFRLVFVVLVPSIVVGAGLSVWVSRRHK
ncbi:MAG: GldG family protein [Oscillospiraceae bacterium]|nr:GldG family protein [Oscillospiraceae bacterium]